MDFQEPIQNENSNINAENSHDAGNHDAALAGVAHADEQKPAQSASSYKSILEQIEALKRQAEAFRAQEISGVITEIRRLITQYNIRPEDLGIYTGTQSYSSQQKGEGRVRQPAPPKYRDPISGIAWSGRGRPPHWVAALAEFGKTLEDCRI